MPNVWSMNTTVRNPDRLIEFLRVLKEFEGEIFDKETQSLYQRAIVKNKFYKPNGIPEDLKLAYQESEPFNDEETDIVFSYVNDKDLRGRTSASRSNQMGLTIAKQASGEVVITELGNKLLDNEIPLEELFLKYFLKWQLPNPLEKRGYKEFNIAPFIATLDVINKVNEREIERNNKSVGLSKREFALFIITLIDYNEIDNVVEEILQYRNNLKNSSSRNEFYKNCLKEKASTVFNVPIDSDKLETKCNNLEDYADSAIRWFRMTQLISYRGDGRYIDISESRMEEVKKLLEVLPRKSNNYQNENEYLNYLIDRDSPVLPWENPDSLKSIIDNIADLIKKTQEKIDLEFPNKRIHFFETEPKIHSSSVSELKMIEETFRNNLNTINNEYKTLQESSLNNLEKYINHLDKLGIQKRSRNKEDNGPLCLEWYTSLSLMALDDANEIKPNFKRGDDGLPIFTAPGGVSDIECYYKSFSMVVEVTLMKGRDQVNNEVQPLLRHYKDFDAKSNDKYALFIAPFLHRDSKNMFEFYCNSPRGYEGESVKLIPLTIELYTKLLRIVLENYNQNKRINHLKLKEFFDICVDITKNELTQVWEEKINESLDIWGVDF